MWEEDEDAVSLSPLSLSPLSLSSLSLLSLSLFRALAHSPPLNHPLPPSLPLHWEIAHVSLTLSLFVRQVIDIIMKHNDQKDDTAAVKALCVQKFDLCKSSDIAVSKAHEEL